MKNKYRVKKFCASFLIVCMVLENFAMPGIAGQNTGQTDSAVSVTTELVTDEAAGAGVEDTVDNAAGADAGDATDNAAGADAGDAADNAAGADAGDAADNTAGADTGDTTDENAGDATGGAGTDETAGAGADETAGAGTDETAGAETDETAGAGTDETAGAETDETAGAETDETAGAETDETAGAETDETAGAEADETAGAGAEGGAGGAAGAGTDPAAKPAGKPAKEDSGYSWEAMTDEELAAWLMDEANAEKIKEILMDNTGEEYQSLHERLETIFAGQDTERAEQVHGRLTALLQSIEMAEIPIATYADADPDPYIYFDLAAGNVTIGKNSYTGYVYVGGTGGTTAEKVTGNHTDINKYYIYQSTDANRDSTGYALKDNFDNKRGCRVPSYDRVSYDSKPWTDYITNNTDVEGVSIAWDTAAANIGRVGTPNHITFESASNYTADVTIDNIWSIYHNGGVNRTAGGIGANLKNNGIDCEKTHITIRLKGDNRVGCVHYSAGKGRGNWICFVDGENISPTEGASAESVLSDEEFVLLDDKTDAEDSSLDEETDITDHFSDEAEDEESVSIDEYAGSGEIPGSITVADFQTDWQGNHWSSAIGAADSPANIGDLSDGIVIESGVIYAGTTPEDNCTAIGGGGNQYGGVTINGGTVTAVVSSTGTAIGGGIGYSNAGGNTDIIINGGTIYAYNLGIEQGTPDNFPKFIPAAAIGGGGSQGSDGNEETTVTINGGRIYAQSLGGAAIGGGCSANGKGGPAIINITGGTIIAKSTDGMYGSEEISPGVSIGGGTGKTGGGSVTLNISGENTVLRTGSIGGGKTTGSGTLGSAKVTITGGDITGQVIMAGTGDKDNSCSFTMSGGKIHGTDVINGNKVEDAGEFTTDPQPDVKIQYLEKNGGAVWMEDSLGETKISGGTIEGCTARLGGAIYMKGGTFNLSGGGKIQGNKAVRLESDSEASQPEPDRGYGGGVYVTGGNAGITGGSILKNEATIRGGGVYLDGGSVKVSDGAISENKAGVGENLPVDVGRGGGVYLEGTSTFTMDGGVISDNVARYRGGGIFLKTSPALNGGVITGNTAKDGGGVCVNGDRLKLENPEMQIYGNTAENNGGGVAVLNGAFILDGGNVGVEKASPNNAVRGGGVFVTAERDTAGTGADDKTNVTVKKGNIWYNSAKEGGGVYLDKGKGDFTLEGADASINNNEAENGGGIYLYKDPLLNEGRIAKNTATANGGGVYISDCPVTLNPTGSVVITENHAQNGAGIYIHGIYSSSGDSDGSGNTGNPDDSVDAISSASPDHKVGLSVGPDFKGTVSFTDNIATDSGGAVCIDTGRFYQESNNITITGNQAKNGGGVAVLKGNFTMSAGSIGSESGSNTATNGGGVYVSDGEVWLKGGSVQYNGATDGGGAYVTGGKMVMLGRSLISNVAEKNGGGGYVAGNFDMLDGIIGGENNGNTAIKGGGVYVSDGNVTMVDGDISYNSAAEDGGGVFVFTTDNKVKVMMLSGKLNNNTARENGGGMAVESSSKNSDSSDATEGEGDDPLISVEIGCLRDHKLNSEGKPGYPILYEGDYQDYENYDGEHNEHESCPEVKNNTAGGIGGGFFMSSDASVLSFYCVEEADNKANASGQGSDGMDVVGGRVVIGDEHYHNHEHDGKNGTDPHKVPWGYVSMDNSTLVNGGQVDIYGDMTNPIFRDEVTVDIKDKQDDHFMDHRLSQDTVHYKVHYFENFQGGGLYQAMQYDESNAVITIEGALFTHPGYQILGWYTKPEYDPTNEEEQKTEQFYAVGEKFDLSNKEQVPNLGESKVDCEYCDTEKDATLLVLYAIWEANGYTVVFDPNVPQGETYSGEMKNQIHQYGVEQVLTKNVYEYPGHFFHGWNTEADGSGTGYTDGEEVLNLTDQNGVKVTLYAQWDPCEHKDPDRWSYDVVDEGKTLRRICSCGGQTLTATLYAEDTEFDGHTHPATLTLDDETAWGTDKPKIEYTATWSNAVHPDINTIGDLFASDSKEPLHAGGYTATIMKPDGDSTKKVTASVTYNITKAKQSVPEKPTYTVKDNVLSINRVDPDPHNLNAAGIKAEASAQYRLSYYVGPELKTKDWEKMQKGKTELPITMNTAWTSYNVEACYEELNDYEQSKIVRADAVYHYTGDVTVKISCDEGIIYRFEPNVGSGGSLNGANLILTTEDGYYIVGEAYSVEMEVVSSSTNKPNEKLEGNVFSITNIPNNSTLTITIGTARRIPQVEAKVAPGQVFSIIKDTAITISRDSAFTAAFEVSNFDPQYTDATDGETYGTYTKPVLTFGSNIPQDTTIILLDRGKNGKKIYWYYRAASETNSVPLTAFHEMGGSGFYPIPQPEEKEGYVDLSYQFIVDFSQSTAGYSRDSLEMTLKATAVNPDTKAPEMGKDDTEKVTVSMADHSFELKKADDADGLTQSFHCTFAVDPDAKASKWEDRASALILMPKLDGDALPADARIKVEMNGATTYLYETDGRFIIPLSLQKGMDETVKVTLQSALFPAEGSKYFFDTEWQISPSEAGKAPMKGHQAGKIEDVTFVSAEKKMPSLKPTGKRRALTAKDRLKLQVATQNMEDCTVSAALLLKGEDGTYSATGWTQQNVTGSVSVPLGGYDPGSFCVMFTVKKSVDVIMEVPYYFVIKPTQQQTADNTGI